MTDPIFISHNTQDDPFVAELRRALELRGLTAWIDSRNLRGGDRLRSEIERAIGEARAVLLVVSPHALNSDWVHDEIACARRVQRKRGVERFPIVPLLLPGVEPAALRAFFPRGALPLALRVEGGPGGLEAAMTDLLTALGERLPTGSQPHEDVAARPVAELLLKLTDPRIVEQAGTRRAAAEAQLVYCPAGQGEREVESERFLFTAPLGPIEADELRWYLEKYAHWPVGQVYQERAARVEAALPAWGQALYGAVADKAGVREAWHAWEATPKEAERRFSVFVDPHLLEGSPAAQQAEAAEAATLLLGLPWELLHDGRSYLFRGARPVLVRRRLPSRHRFPRLVAELPVRVLLVSPRPEDQAAGYIDHRVIAQPMVEAIGRLGELAALTVLSPPTFPAFEAALAEAEARGEPFHVVHFDGHGVFDKKVGLGGLCFEDPRDAAKLTERRHQTIDAAEVAAVIRERRIPLVFLNACQSALAEQDPTASVAARLLDEGVASVVAMSYSVLVETARRFVSAFYRALAAGARVGQAMLQSQQALHGDTFRLKVFGGHDLRLHDWFVPVLFQEQEDVQLFRRVPSERIAGEIQQARRLRLGDLPQKESLTFVGRSRELLALERMLADQPWAVVVGQGGEGKTTLAVELAAWLVGSQRCARAAFVSLEAARDARAAADALGRQLLPDYTVAAYPDDELLGRALQPIQRALEDEATVIVVDNVESVLPPHEADVARAAGPRRQARASGPPLTPPVQRGENRLPPCEAGGTEGGADFQTLSALLTRLLQADGRARLVFTSREDLPAPFGPDKRRYLRLGRLRRDDAIKLVEQHMPGPPPPDDAARIEELVEAVQGHARSLVLLAPEIHRQGVTVTAAALAQLMARLHAAYPDDRQRSLFASVELSLQRLAPEMRRAIRPLGVFQGGAQLDVLACLLGVEKKELAPMVHALLDINLAEMMPYDHLRLHPALCPYLAAGLTAEESEALTARWAEGMRGLVDYLYRQIFQDTQLAFTLARLELPNLLRLLEHLSDQADAAATLDVATSVEQLLADLDCPRLLQRVVALRERASAQLGGGLSDVQFTARRMAVERLLQAGQVPAAYEAAQRLLAESGAPEAGVSAGNQAVAVNLLGWVLLAGGAAGEALPYFQEAQTRFAALGGAGARMASILIERIGTCLRALGRLEEAARAYEENIRQATALQDARQVAVGQGQLATVRQLQGRYAEAVAGHESAKKIFANLGEPRMVATAWHQIGMAHQQAGNAEAAEAAYRESLALKVRLQDRAGEANTLNQLGNLYHGMGRLEEAAIFYRQAADVYVQLGDQAGEGCTRNNLADTLVKLGRCDEARAELQRAMECFQPYGHAAQPWKAWAVLHDLERAEGDAAAAAQAKAEARRLYLAYRRDGGENHSGGGRLCADFLRAVPAGATAQMAATLRQLAADPGWQAEGAKALLSALQAILSGARDPALADDPALDFDDAVEVELLLAALAPL